MSLRKLAIRRLAGALGLLLALSLVLAPVPVLAVPQMGHIFYGNVTSDGQSVDAGVSVVAKINDQTFASTTVDSQGRYGWETVFEVSADDPDTPEIEGASPGDLVDFYVATVLVDTYPFKIGGYTELNLEIAGVPPQPLTAEAGGPYSGTTGASIALSGSATGGTSPYTYAWDLDNDGEYDDAFDASASYSWETADSYTIGLQVTDVSATATDTATVTVTPPYTPPPYTPPPAPTIVTDLFGTEASFETSSQGKILKTIEATSEDGMLTITIPKDTVALDKDGKRLASLETAVDESPPDPPADANIIGLAYDFGPDGATFDPAITLEYTYDPDALPEGVDEEELVLAYYDEATGEWVELDCVVDTENNTITASVAHFTTFAIIGVVPVVTPPAPAAFSVSSLSVLRAEVEPGETVTIAVSVANTGGESGSYTAVLKIDGVKEDEETVTVAAGGSKTVSFSVTKEEAGSYTVAVDGLSGSFTVVAPLIVLEPAAFSVSYLSFSQLEVEPDEAVIITALVANIGGESGSYTVVLKIDGVKEAEETVTLAAGESQDVSFSVTREEAGNYTVAVDGLSGSFTVVAPEEEEEVPAKPGVNWPLIGGIIGGVVVLAGLLYYFLVFRRRAY